MSCQKVKFGNTVAWISVADEYKIRSGGKEFRFEFHPFCGPSIIGKRGNPLSTLPPGNSPFWDALHATMQPRKWKGERLWIVALYPPVVHVDKDKCASLKREILAEVPNWFN